jgi:hypothetical protein
VTNYDATKFTAGLRLYFMQESNESSPVSALETWTDFAQLQTIKGTWQGTLDQFFHHKTVKMYKRT